MTQKLQKLLLSSSSATRREGVTKVYIEPSGIATWLLILSAGSASAIPLYYADYYSAIIVTVFSLIVALFPLPRPQSITIVSSHIYFNDREELGSGVMADRIQVTYFFIKIWVGWRILTLYRDQMSERDWRALSRALNLLKLRSRRAAANEG